MKKNRIDLVLSDELKAALDRAAKESELSMSAFIRMLVKSYLKENGLL